MWKLKSRQTFYVCESMAKNPTFGTEVASVTGLPRCSYELWY